MSDVHNVYCPTTFKNSSGVFGGCQKPKTQFFTVCFGNNLFSYRGKCKQICQEKPKIYLFLAENETIMSVYQLSELCNREMADCWAHWGVPCPAAAQSQSAGLATWCMKWHPQGIISRVGFILSATTIYFEWDNLSSWLSCFLPTEETTRHSAEG